MNSRFACCNKTKETKNYFCIVCHNLFHKSCADRTKFQVILGEHKIICSEECIKNEDRQRQYEDIIKELNEKVETLISENNQKDAHIKRLKRNTKDFENDVLIAEKEYEKKIEENNKIISELNKEIIIKTKDNKEIKEQLEISQLSIQKLSQELEDLIDLNKKLLTSIKTITQDNEVYFKEVKRLRSEIYQLNENKKQCSCKEGSNSANSQEIVNEPKNNKTNISQSSGTTVKQRKAQSFFVDNFWPKSRLDHVSLVMGYHPSYLNHFLKTQNFILKGDGPLPYDYRHYIAIMAAGRHQCSYLISLQKEEFLLQGGNHNWLKGLSHIPPKLRNLYDINKILAHRPWLLNRSHIEKLTKGKDSWSLAEVVHALVILAHFHSLCSFVFSCGLNQELDEAKGYNFKGDMTYEASAVRRTTENSSSKAKPKEEPQKNHKDWTSSTTTAPPSPTEPEVGITTLMQRMKTLSEKPEESNPVELAKRFESIETQSAEIRVVGSEPQEPPAGVDCFVDDGTFIYQDFAKRADPQKYPIFRVQDYSWDDHGYSLVNRFYNDVGNFLDDKFKTAYDLTYYTMGGRTQVDTSRFRRAIWNYSQSLFGIRHDDYDYAEVNALIERSLKAFIKSGSCYPERVTKNEYDRVLREFEHSEKVHVNLMILESRMQAELMYALRTVNIYMTN